MGKRNRQFYPAGVVLIGVFLVCVLVLLCSHGIRKNLEKEMRGTLRDIATQNVLVINQKLIIQYHLLEGFASQIQESPKGIGNVIKDMQVFLEPYGFKRMGFVDMDGYAVTTDGFRADFSDRIFFQRSMEGKIWITAAQQDQLDSGAEEINVFSIPVYGKDSEKIIGVVFATYENSIFQNMLDVDFFDGKGYSCVVSDKGLILAHSQNSPIAGEENFFHFLARRRADEKKTQRIIEDFEKGQSGFGEKTSGEEEGSTFYYVPVSDNLYGAQWYLVAIAPKSVLKSRMNPVLNSVRWLTLGLCLLVFVGSALFTYREHRRKKELEKLAYKDILTGGSNFLAFRDSAQEWKDSAGYVIAMDLSDFKLINSNFGVKKGDETLCALWEVLEESIYEGEYVARVNADRFVIYLKAEQRKSVIWRVETLIDHINRIPEKLHIPPLYPIFGIYYSDALGEADRCYGYAVQAKHLVKGRRDRHYAFYDEIDEKLIAENHEMEEHFEEALKTREFEIWYQPKFRTVSSEAIGAEALVRWRRKDGHLISPGRFIPIFERNGSIRMLDEYVFREVCRQQKCWLDEGQNPVPVSVNVSRVSLYFYDIVERYRRILKEYELDPSYVQLEITESATVDNQDIAELIEAFHESGFELLLDDFGSGYSSLASLNTLHFDTLKLDKSLIDYIGDERGEKLLKYIICLGQSLGLKITAEGVESEGQFLFLKKMACDDIQGFFFSKPLPITEYHKIFGANRNCSL